MNEWNLPLALLDIVPVVLFLFGCIELMKAFYPKMTQAQYSMFSAGSIMVFLSGMMKAVWKLMYVMEICDYAMLSDAFFPVQSTGFVLLALSTIRLAGKKKDKSDYASYSAVPVVAIKMPFIMLTFLGTTIFYGSLSALGVKTKNKMTVVFFISAYAFDMIQVFLASKFDNSSLMNWLAEIVNTLAQVCLWLGAKRLNQAYQDEKYDY